MLDTSYDSILHKLGTLQQQITKIKHKEGPSGRTTADEKTLQTHKKKRKSSKNLLRSPDENVNRMKEKGRSSSKGRVMVGTVISRNEMILAGRKGERALANRSA